MDRLILYKPHHIKQLTVGKQFLSSSVPMVLGDFSVWKISQKPCQEWSEYCININNPLYWKYGGIHNIWIHAQTEEEFLKCWIREGNGLFNRQWSGVTYSTSGRQHGRAQWSGQLGLQKSEGNPCGHHRPIKTSHHISFSISGETKNLC